MKIYHNPLNSDALKIEIDENVIIEQIKIYDSKRCEIKNKFTLTKFNENLNELELKGLTNGFYTIETRTNNEILRQTFIKLQINFL
jgi:hypothetical protein